LIEQALRFTFKKSNNQVEYEALIAGMLWAKELEPQRLLAKSDSLLVTEQVTSEYQTNDPHLASYLRYVRILRTTFSAFDLVHVPKEQNSRVDLLPKLASSGKGGRQRSVIQETLKSVRIYSLKQEGEGVNCLRGVFENFFRFNKILCVNPKQESS